MSKTTSTPLMENDLLKNEHVKELLDIMKSNGKDAGAIIAMIGYVGSMESQLNRAAEDLQAVMVELNAMRDERNHPLRTAMQNAAQSMERNISEARTQLGAIKAQIIEGCKQAVASFKQHGISALDSVARFFKIKPALQNLRNNLRSDIKKDQATISRIKAISTQYHKAGRSIHNFGRALQGKKPIPGVKPNGKLAALVSAPFHSEIKALTNAVKSTDKAIAALTRLEKSASKKVPPKKAAERKDDKPSVKETMKQLAEKIAQDKKETPASEKSKHREAEL